MSCELPLIMDIRMIGCGCLCRRVSRLRPVHELDHLWAGLGYVRYYREDRSLRTSVDMVLILQQIPAGTKFSFLLR